MNKITYCCNNCGNTETFLGTASESIEGWREWLCSFDGEGSIEDYQESHREEITDTHLDEWDVNECGECNSHDIEEREGEELEEWKELHFKDGEFVKEIPSVEIDEDGNVI